MSGLSPEDRALVAATWDFRARAERTARGRFERMARELEATGAEPIVVKMAYDAVEDETRHAGLCDALAKQFGFVPCGHHPELLSSASLAPQGLSPSDAILYEVVAFCCLTETINAAMLTEVLRFATDPDIRETSRAILRDEVEHSRLGWAHLQAEREKGRGDFLSDEFVGMLSVAGIEEIFDPLDRARDGEHLADYGELSFERRTGIFKGAVNDLVFPGWEQMGLSTDAAREWLSAFGI